MQGTPGGISQAGKKEYLLRLCYQIYLLIPTTMNICTGKLNVCHFGNAAWNSTGTKPHKKLKKPVNSRIKYFSRKENTKVLYTAGNIQHQDYKMILFKLVPKIVYSLIFLTSDHWVMVSASLLYMNQDKFFTHPINQGIVLQERKCSQVLHSIYLRKLYLSNSQNTSNLLSSCPTVI